MYNEQNLTNKMYMLLFVHKSLIKLFLRSDKINMLEYEIATQNLINKEQKLLGTSW